MNGKAIKNEGNEKALKAAKATAVVHAEYSGPLPQASEFKKYEDTLPGAANRILKMAEKSLDAEIEDERRHRTITFVNMLFNKIIIYILIVLSFVLLLLGKNLEALFAGLVPIIQVLSTIELRKGKKK